MHQPRLILLPGLAADHRMFFRELEAFPSAEAPAWLEPRRGESLASYAARWGDRLDLARRPAVIAGLSMGGMVALEMAHAHGAMAVGLIASARSPRAVSPALKAVERLGRLTPDGVVGALKPISGAFIGRGRIDPKDRALLVGMARDCPVHFLRFAGPAIVRWPGRADPGPGIPVRHIHGARDWVISARLAKPDELVPGGAHVLNMSHPDRVRAFLASLVSTVGTDAGPGRA
jgi:pimeloyl-ACP methyl ester carboxylesterase